MCILCKSNNLASPTRRRTLAALSMASMAGVSGLFGQAYAAAPPKPDNILLPDQEMERLMQGNARYSSNASTQRDFASTRAALAHGQHPSACLLRCADSRLSPELAFYASRCDLLDTPTPAQSGTNQ